MSSSIFSVAIGSRAEHGSSMRMTSGSTAIVRAMHSRCCWPPESPMPGCVEAVLDLLPQPGAAQRLLDALARVAAAVPLRRRPAATLSKIDMVGNGLGFWKTIPMARRTLTTSTPAS